jgi:hypothetical protein
MIVCGNGYSILLFFIFQVPFTNYYTGLYVVTPLAFFILNDCLYAIL